MPVGIRDYLTSNRAADAVGGRSVATILRISQCSHLPRNPPIVVPAPSAAGASRFRERTGEVFQRPFAVPLQCHMLEFRAANARKQFLLGIASGAAYSLVLRLLPRYRPCPLFEIETTPHIIILPVGPTTESRRPSSRGRRLPGGRRCSGIQPKPPRAIRG